MTYTVSSGMLNSTIPYHTYYLDFWPLTLQHMSMMRVIVLHRCTKFEVRQSPRLKIWHNFHLSINQPSDLDLWFSTSKWGPGYLCHRFPDCQLSACYAFHSWLKVRHTTDKQADRRRPSTLNAPPFGVGHQTEYWQVGNGDFGSSFARLRVPVVATATFIIWCCSKNQDGLTFCYCFPGCSGNWPSKWVLLGLKLRVSGQTVPKINICLKLQKTKSNVTFLRHGIDCQTQP